MDIDMYLRIALELPLKRLIVGGFERVYEIGRVFRNEGISIRHNPEFTLLEVYQAFTDYEGMMDLTEDLFRTVAAKKCIRHNKNTIWWTSFRFRAKFARITMTEAVKQYSGIDFDQVENTEEAKNWQKEHNIAFEDRHEKGDILSFFFEEYVEKNLIQPTFIIDYPIEISPLSKKSRQSWLYRTF